MYHLSDLPAPRSAMSEKEIPPEIAAALTTRHVGSQADPAFVTKWDVVNRAKGGGNDRDSANALEELCRIYRHPIYIALRYKHYFDHHDAEDVAQSFITWLIHGGYLNRADPTKGRFRSFLLSYLDNYVANHKRKIQAQKRGGRVVHVPAEFPTETNRSAVEPKDENTPEREFDRAWTLATFREALDRLRAKYTVEGKGDEFETLQSFLLRRRGEGESYTEAAARLGITKENMRQRVSRFGRKFRQTLEELIKPMVSEDELDDELSYLWRCFEK
jgi:RNA polymerase sigma factor (sigma-70 family)